jgi:hypothetical protein
MAKRKFKGVLTKDLRSYGEALENKPAGLKKGDEVVVWKRREYDNHLDGLQYWTGGYEYHYNGVNGGFCRSTEFLLKGQKDEDNNRKK